MSDDFLEGIKSGDHRKQLTVLRDRLAEELAGFNCCDCGNRRTKQDNTAALVLRLQQVLRELAELSEDKSSEAPSQKKTLASLREESNNVVTPFDRKNAPREQSTRIRDKRRDGA